MPENLYYLKTPKFLPDLVSGRVPECRCVAGSWKTDCPYSTNEEETEWIQHLVDKSMVK